MLAVATSIVSQSNFQLNKIGLCPQLHKWALKEVGLVQAEEYIAFTNQCQIVPLDSMIAVRAAKLSSDKNLAATDAIIYSKAFVLKADLLACDAHFKDLPGVIYIEK